MKFKRTFQGLALIVLGLLTSFSGNSSAGQRTCERIIYNARITHYHTVKEEFFDKWGPSNPDHIGHRGVINCKIYQEIEPNFYNAVKCQGTGITDNGKMCRWNTIHPEDDRNCKPLPKDTVYGYGAKIPGTNQRYKVKPHRTIAVDPKVIPIGTIVEIELFDKTGVCMTDVCQEWKGCYRAEDTGQAIKGKHIDLFAGYGVWRDSRGRNRDPAKGLPDRGMLYVGSNCKLQE